MNDSHAGRICKLGHATQVLKLETPIDLRSTLSNLGGRFGREGWWCAFSTSAGTATLRLRRNDLGIEVETWGDGADDAMATAPDLLGQRDNREDFSTNHPLVGNLFKRIPGFRLGCTGRVFDALLVAIVTQKVTGKEAGRGLKNLYNRYGVRAPGPNESLRVPPKAETLAEVPYYDYHPLGIEKRRADTIKRAAAHGSQLEEWATRDSRDVRRSLEALPGIGQWTSAETVAVSHGDPDAVSVGDYHLKNVISWHLAGEPRGTDERMLELLEEFRPHRARVIRLIEMLGAAPAYGPRSPTRRFERI